MLKALEVIEKIAQTEGFDNLYYLDLYTEEKEVRFGRQDRNYDYTLSAEDFNVLKEVLTKLEVDYEVY